MRRMKRRRLPPRKPLLRMMRKMKTVMMLNSLSYTGSTKTGRARMSQSQRVTRRRLLSKRARPLLKVANKHLSQRASRHQPRRR